MEALFYGFVLIKRMRVSILWLTEDINTSSTERLELTKINKTKQTSNVEQDFAHKKSGCASLIF